MSNTSHRLSGGWHQPYHQYWQRLSLHYLHYLLLTQPFQPPVRAQSPDTNALTSILAKATELARVKQFDAQWCLRIHTHTHPDSSTATATRTPIPWPYSFQLYLAHCHRPAHDASLSRAVPYGRADNPARGRPGSYYALTRAVATAPSNGGGEPWSVDAALWPIPPACAALPPLRRAACARHVPAPPTLAAQVD